MKWLKNNAMKIVTAIYAAFSLALLWAYAFSNFTKLILFQIWYAVTAGISITTTILVIILLFKGTKVENVRNKIKKDKEKRKK